MGEGGVALNRTDALRHTDYTLRRAEEAAISLVNVGDMVKLPDDLLNAAVEAASAIQHLRHVLSEVNT